jgi:hypothetical protein
VIIVDVWLGGLHGRCTFKPEMECDRAEVAKTLEADAPPLL